MKRSANATASGISGCSPWPPRTRFIRNRSVGSLAVADPTSAVGKRRFAPEYVELASTQGHGPSGGVFRTAFHIRDGGFCSAAPSNAGGFTRRPTGALLLAGSTRIASVLLCAYVRMYS